MDLFFFYICKFKKKWRKWVENELRNNQNMKMWMKSILVSRYFPEGWFPRLAPTADSADDTLVLHTVHFYV